METDKTSTNDDVTSKAARRRFLQSLGIVAVTSVASTFNILHAPANANEKKSNGVSSNRRYGMLIDTAKCARDCDACVRGCDEEHGLGADKHGGVRDEIRARWIQKVDLEDKLTGRRVSLPMLCQHCDSAPCVDVCPTGASFKRADGIVLVNKHTCIGCRYCMMACPYNARSFIHEKITEQKSWAPRGKGTVESCTLCVHRIDADVEQGPACAEACTQAGHSAITFGDLNDENSEISKRLTNEPSVQVRSDLELNTGVRYTAL